MGLASVARNNNSVCSKRRLSEEDDAQRERQEPAVLSVDLLRKRARSVQSTALLYSNDDHDNVCSNKTAKINRSRFSEDGLLHTAEYGTNMDSLNGGKQLLKESCDIWPYEIESAFIDALRLILKNGTYKIKILDKNYGRNELISIYIKHKTNETRTKKQISSHIQVWKKAILNKLNNNIALSDLEKEILTLIEHGVKQDESNIKRFFKTFEEIIDPQAYKSEEDKHQRHIKPASTTITTATAPTAEKSQSENILFIATTPAGENTVSSSRFILPTMSNPLPLEGFNNKTLPSVRKLSAPNYILDKISTTKISEEYDIRGNCLVAETPSTATSVSNHIGSKSSSINNICNNTPHFRESLSTSDFIYSAARPLLRQRPSLQETTFPIHMNYYGTNSVPLSIANSLHTPSPVHTKFPSFKSNNNDCNNCIGFKLPPVHNIPLFKNSFSQTTNTFNNTTGPTIPELLNKGDSNGEYEKRDIYSISPKFEADTFEVPLPSSSSTSSLLLSSSSASSKFIHPIDPRQSAATLKVNAPNSYNLPKLLTQDIKQASSGTENSIPTNKL